MTILGTIFRVLMIERGAKRVSSTQLIQDLQTTAQTIDQRVAHAADTPENRQQIRHVIGMERWGQSRLQVALGDPFVQDESDRYYPAPELNLAELRETFATTRAETVRIAQQILAKGMPLTTKVLHNSMGMTSWHSWLFYLNLHADFESKRVKGAEIKN